jgi:serine protease Do
MGFLSRRGILAGAAAMAAVPALVRPARARTGPDSFAPLIKRVLPSVVNIAVTETVASADPFEGLPPELRQMFRDRFRQRRQQVQGAGSGFVIDASGIIVSNNHVVGNADKIVVSLSDGTQLPAKLLGTDDLTDIAVVKVAAPRPLPAVTWGDSRALEVGDWVIAAGNPFGLGGSVSAGIVSARGRDLGVGLQDDFIQIDAPINPGNSGGPLFNSEGEVVGINTAIFSPTGSSVGIGFAIPSAVAREIVARLRANGHIDRGWIGVRLADVEATARSGAAAGVAAVERNSPAARAGIRPGDLIVAANGQPTESARAVIRVVAGTPPGQKVQLLVVRQGRNLEIEVSVGLRSREED